MTISAAMNSTPDSARAPSLSTPFTIPNRTLVVQGAVRGILRTQSLEQVRDQLANIVRLQDVQDLELTLSDIRVDFTRDRMEAYWPGEGSLWHLLTSTGASQLARDVLPPRHFTGLKKLAKIDEEGAQLASRTWMKFSSTFCQKTERLVRTVRMRLMHHDRAEIFRVIRSCHGKGYSTYDNLQFVQDILDNAGEFSQMPVLGWTLSDDGMRIRFACIDGGKAAFMHLDPSILLTEPLPMVEAWNSEVGRRKVGLRGGMWRLASATGIGHWSAKTEHTWIHRGKSERIAASVQGSLRDLHEVAMQVCLAYDEARSVVIDKPELWLRQQVEEALTQRALDRAVTALSEPCINPGGTLASVIDAIGIAAQLELDIYDQYDIERVASILLHKGITDATDGMLFAKGVE